MSLCASVYTCFVVTCLVRADLLALVCGVLGQVWYLIESIPDLCTLTYFVVIQLRGNLQNAKSYSKTKIRKVDLSMSVQSYLSIICQVQLTS